MGVLAILLNYYVEILFFTISNLQSLLYIHLSRDLCYIIYLMKYNLYFTDNSFTALLYHCLYAACLFLYIGGLTDLLLYHCLTVLPSRCRLLILHISRLITIFYYIAVSMLLVYTLYTIYLFHILED